MGADRSPVTDTCLMSAERGPDPRDLPDGSVAGSSGSFAHGSTEHLTPAGTSGRVAVRKIQRFQDRTRKSRTLPPAAGMLTVVVFLYLDDSGVPYAGAKNVRIVIPKKFPPPKTSPAARVRP